MSDLFIGTHVFPWEVKDESAVAVLGNLKAARINAALVGINPSGQLHPPIPGTWFPHNPVRTQQTSEDGRFFVKFDARAYRGLLKPVNTKLDSFDQYDVLEALASQKIGVELYAWIECLNNRSGVQLDKNSAIVNISGERNRFWMCANNPDVREFLVALVEDIASRYEIDGLALDKIQFLWPHISFQDLGTAITCFCKHCSQAASELGYDLERIRDELKSMIESAMKPGPLWSFTQLGIFDKGRRAKSLIEFLNFRCTSIAGLVRQLCEELRKAAPSAEMGLCLRPPFSGWLVGQRYRDLREYCDWIKPMTRNLLWGTYTRELADDALKYLTEQKERFVKLWYDFAGFEGDFEPKIVEQTGLAPSHIYSETLKAAVSVAGRAELYGEVETWRGKNEEIGVRAEQCVKAGADGLVLWNYDWSPFRGLRAATDAALACSSPL